MNQQGWDFVVVTDRDDLRELSKAWRHAAHVATSAATIVLVIPRTSDREERDTLWYDLGQATMSIMVAAADLGIGSGHASIGDQSSSCASCSPSPRTESPRCDRARIAGGVELVHAGRPTRSAAVRRRGPSWSLVSA